MEPLHHQIYVAQELHRLRLESPHPGAPARINWLTAEAASRRARRHALALWLGGCLVAVGVRLQAWAEAHTATDLGSGACDEAGT